MGLIEEAQSLASRMESALGDEHRMEWKEEEYQDLKTDIRELKRKKKQLKKEIYELEEKKIDMGLEDVVGDSDDNLRDKVRQGEG